MIRVQKTWIFLDRHTRVTPEGIALHHKFSTSRDQLQPPCLKPAKSWHIATYRREVLRSGSRAIRYLVKWRYNFMDSRQKVCRKTCCTPDRPGTTQGSQEANTAIPDLITVAVLSMIHTIPAKGLTKSQRLKYFMYVEHRCLICYRVRLLFY